ncbi:MAG: hypothetical protein IKA11_03165 [Clostridia bacterium]|nr:hypothetical protein [Clostridia bacterium]
MKIIKKIIILGIIFLLALCLVKGINGCFSCKQNEEQKWFNEYMSKISVEKQGYEFCNLDTDGAIKIENTVGEFIVQGLNVTISYNHKDNFEIHYNDQTVRLNSEFINSKTEVYGAINAMWSSYRKEDPPTSLLNKVCLVTIYNGELFIFTGAHNVNLWGGWSGKYPVVMYTYDIIANDVLYLGYYNGKWIDLDANSPVPFGFRYVDE